jgi:hypothetical protein
MEGFEVYWLGVLDTVKIVASASEPLLLSQAFQRDVATEEPIQVFYCFNQQDLRLENVAWTCRNFKFLRRQLSYAQLSYEARERSLILWLVAWGDRTYPRPLPRVFWELRRWARRYSRTSRGIVQIINDAYLSYLLVKCLFDKETGLIELLFVFFEMLLVDHHVLLGKAH